MPRHRKTPNRRSTYQRDESILGFIMYELEHGWITLTLMLTAGITLFLTGVVFGWLRGS